MANYPKTNTPNSREPGQVFTAVLIALSFVAYDYTHGRPWVSVWMLGVALFILYGNTGESTSSDTERAPATLAGPLQPWEIYTARQPRLRIDPKHWGP